MLDNLVNESYVKFRSVEKITGESKFLSMEADIRDTDTLRDIFKREEPTGVIHFAGLKAVVNQHIPLPTMTTISLELLVFKSYGSKPKNIIFSSSATVYGDPHTVPILEDFPLSVTNPYGRTKLITRNLD